MTTRFARPRNPPYLIKAARTIFGASCLNCGVSRPLVMAHLVNWPDTVDGVRHFRSGKVPPPAWHMAVARDRYHNIGNVVPLCANCHTLMDAKSDEDVTLCGVIALRNDAATRSDVATQLVKYIRTELSGRPNRCMHMDEHGRRRLHSRSVDTTAIAAPLRWVSNAIRDGTLAIDPDMYVEQGNGWYYHVQLANAFVAFAEASSAATTRATRTEAPVT